MCPLCQALLLALGIGDIADKRPSPNGASDDRVLPASVAPLLCTPSPSTASLQPEMLLYDAHAERDSGLG